MLKRVLGRGIVETEASAGHSSGHAPQREQLGLLLLELPLKLAPAGPIVLIKAYLDHEKPKSSE